MSEGGYRGDPRVVAELDGSFRIPDGVAGDWWVRPSGDGWVAGNEMGGVLTGDRYDRRPRVFGSSDEALRAIVGLPQ